MIYVVNDIFISKNCPKYLQPLCDEIRKMLHYEFEDVERLERFVNGSRSFVNNLPDQKKATLSFHHEKHDDGGTITILRGGAGFPTLVSLSYFTLHGRLEISRTEPMRIYPQNFIEEGGEV